MQTETDTADSSSNALVPGSHLDGRYLILEKIGAGGMGEVYKAHDLQMDRVVAVKVLPPVDITPESLQRFFREAKVLGSLDHANIVKLYNFAIGEDFPYQVADLLEGRSLAERLKEGPLKISEFNSIFLQIIDALEYASELGLVHRDLKPANIFLCCEPDNTQRAVLLDFGIVRQLSGESAAITATRAVIGSPAYMSPEQCRGHSVDQRSDIYSLGCVFYESLTGKPPFHDAESAYEIMLKHMNESAPELKSFVGGRACKSQLAQVIQRCLNKRPEARPASFRELRTALNSALENTVETMRFTPPEKSRFGFPAKLCLLLVLSMILPIGVGSVIFLQMQQQTKREVEAEKGKPETDELRQQFLGLEKDRSERLSRHPNPDLLKHRALSYKDLADRFKDKHRYREALTALERAMELAAYGDRPHSLIADMHIETANVYLSEWKWFQKEEGTNQLECIDAADRELEKVLTNKKCDGSRYRFKALTKKCQVMMLKNQVKEAKKFFDECVALAPHVLRKGDTTEEGCDVGKSLTKLSSDIHKGARHHSLDAKDKIRIFQMQAELARVIPEYDYSGIKARERAKSWFNKAYPSASLASLPDYNTHWKILQELLRNQYSAPRQVDESGEDNDDDYQNPENVESPPKPPGPPSIDLN